MSTTKPKQTTLHVIDLGF